LKLFKNYVEPGMTALDIGCGLGFNALGLAQLVGPGGNVIALDIQSKMLEGVMRRAGKLGLEEKITPLLAEPDDLKMNSRVHFALAFYMVHEVKDKARFLDQVAACILPGGYFMMVEPPVHVTKKGFEKTVDLVQSSGLALEEKYKIFFGRSAVFKNTR
jgi:ubiquinone/menaquinone biosynthesis C-methylase UbiE